MKKCYIRMERFAFIYMLNMQLSGTDELSVFPELGVIGKNMKIHCQWDRPLRNPKHKPLTPSYYMNSLQGMEKW